jgi:hypothetical protein
MNILGKTSSSQALCSHARAHALSEGHPVIEQMTGGGSGFAWCYAEGSYVR